MNNDQVTMGAGDIRSLIALMTQNLSKLTELNEAAGGGASSSRLNTVSKVVIKIEDCPVKRDGTFLDS